MTPTDNDEEHVDESGTLCDESTPFLRKSDADLLDTLTTNNHDKTTAAMDWPSVGAKALTEFGDANIFCLAFPWLFPGGIGDINQPRQQEVDIFEWAELLTYYRDGRFAADSMWPFFTLNYAQRHRNQSTGCWFVKDFASETPPTINDLKREIEAGNTKFIDKMVYYSKHVKGSDAYWRFKKAELYSWIDYHVDKGHGAPNLFITLSCAEYFWPDLKRLLEERIYVAEGTNVDLDENKTAYNKAVNTYSIVIQEYFQLRTKDFLDYVCSKAFNIKHYWCRFEFAKSRGQIHAHLLAILDDATSPDGYNCRLFDNKDNPEKQAEIVAQWAIETFNMTACHPVGPDDEDPNKDIMEAAKSYHPCKTRVIEAQNFFIDDIALINITALHDCSDYCMRKLKKQNKSKQENSTANKKCRTCRNGCGKEMHYMKADTPGWKKQDKPTIDNDPRGYRKLNMPRNSRRLNQTALDMLRCWRANCDVQIILYESNPCMPDASEIAKVTDYVVAYACKGNCTMALEKKQIRQIILR